MSTKQQEKKCQGAKVSSRERLDSLIVNIIIGLELSPKEKLFIVFMLHERNPEQAAVNAGLTSAYGLTLMKKSTIDRALQLAATLEDVFAILDR